MGSLTTLTWSVHGLVLLLVIYSKGDDSHPYSQQHHTIRDIELVPRGEEAEGTGEETQNDTQFIRDKWQNHFKFHDLDHDTVISREDTVIQQNVFIISYNLSDTDNVKQEILTYWSCLTFNQLDNRLSMEQLVNLEVQFYIQNKTQTKEHFHHCADALASAVDQNQDGYLALDELYIYYKSVNHGNKKLAREKYRMICPNTESPCPLKNASDHWAELLSGNDQEKYKTVKQTYEKVGMPLDDLVE